MTEPSAPGSIADLGEEAIRQALFAEAPSGDARAVDFGLHFPPDLQFRRAGVLIPFIYTEHGWEVLFTRRTDLVQDHKGQVSFPGGAEEPEDATPAHTALREAWEEIGLPPQGVRILGFMEPMISRGGFRITPVVGVIPWPFPMIISELEVSRVFTIPLRWLADPAHYTERIISDGEVVRNIPVIYYELYDGEMLWGISGRIMVSLIDRLLAHLAQ
jgi:8-oxo-dGTP pyrophosphatase MutT (NUDIX family)